MKIIITEPELTQIVRNHVLSTVSMQDGRDIKIDFSATRGVDGVTATIDIPYIGVTALDMGLSKGDSPGPEPETPIKPVTKRGGPAVARMDTSAMSGGEVEASASDNASTFPDSPAPAGPVGGIFADAKKQADAAVASQASLSDTPPAGDAPAAAGTSLFP